MTDEMLYKLQLRIRDKIVRHESGCWVWTAAVRNAGYGAIKVCGKVVDAHRAAFIAFRGDIPEGKTVSRICHTALCVNPDHLALLSRQENVCLAIADGCRLPYVRTRLLSDAQELTVVQWLRAGATQSAVREHFHLSASSLQRLMVRRGLMPSPVWMKPALYESKESP